MNTRLTYTHFLSPPSPIFKFHPIPHRPRPTPSPRNRIASFPKFNTYPSNFSPRNPNFKVNMSGAMDSNDGVVVSGDECGDLVVEACLTRTLPPALTLQHGLESLKEAVQDLKLHPPCSTSGMIRFQVAVPPSTNAFNWFYSQPESLRVFPQFYISKELEGPSHESAFVSKNCGPVGCLVLELQLTSDNPRPVLEIGTHLEDSFLQISVG